MKEYLKNLWLALCGRYPYKKERDQLAVEVDVWRENSRALKRQYMSALDMMEKKDKQIADYQHLTENLRERLADKDTLMERMKADYQERIEQYTREIDRLSKDYYHAIQLD